MASPFTVITESWLVLGAHMVFQPLAIERYTEVVGTVMGFTILYFGGGFELIAGDKNKIAGGNGIAEGIADWVALCSEGIREGFAFAG